MSTGTRVAWCGGAHAAGVPGAWWYWEHQTAVPLCDECAERARTWLAHPLSAWYREHCRLERMEA